MTTDTHGFDCQCNGCRDPMMAPGKVRALQVAALVKAEAALEVASRPYDVLANPAAAPIPTDPQALCALCDALADDVTVKTMGAFCAYMQRLSDAGLREYVVRSVRRLLARPADEPERAHAEAAAARLNSLRKLSCGCCTGNGTGNMPGNDRCVCLIHQDVPRGEPAHVCLFHKLEAHERAHRVAQWNLAVDYCVNQELRNIANPDDSQS